jgi:hypothetical protein
VNDLEVRVRLAETSDLPRLASFACSTGVPWEDEVQAQIRGPLPTRYLTSPPKWDGRMVVAVTPTNELLAVGAHRIEPIFVPDIGYIEVVAVALGARGTLTDVGGRRKISLGELILLTMMDQMARLGRHFQTFARVDRRNARSLALCDRVGLGEEQPDPDFPELVQRWGDLPS